MSAERRPVSNPEPGAGMLLLIDGHSVIYRSYYAFVRKPLRNSRGQNTSAVFGFANTLRKLLAELAPDYCAVVYDTPERTFRQDKLEAYKAQRPPAPDDLPPQIPVVKALVRAWGVAGLELAGYEADDVLGTLARRFAAGCRVTIATSDKDMLQLVGGAIDVYDPWKQRRYAPDDVREKLGVAPEQVPDLLALSGDSVDNIPGVPGVGPRRAQEALARWGSLERVIENDGRVRLHAGIARLSRELATIATDAPVAVELDGLRPQPPDTGALRTIFGEMGFTSLLAGLPVPEAAAVTARAAFDPEAVRRAGWFSFCCRPPDGVWLSWDGERAAFLGLDDRPKLAALLADARLVKVGHGIKPQLKWLHAQGLEAALPLYDVEIGAWLCDANRRRHALEDVELQVLGGVTPAPEESARAAVIHRLYRALEPQVSAMGLARVAAEIEMPLIPVLARMEERGIRVDRQELARLEQELDGERAGLLSEIHRLAGREFNVNSPKQLGQVLFEELKLGRGKRTRTGYSTGADVLAELAPSHPIVQQVLRYRELSKLCGTYLGPLQAAISAATGRVHCTFDQTGTATGRLSASDPNLQNVPVRTDLGRRVRSAFVAEPGNVLVSADYSQIELRVLAHFSGDERLAEAFRRDEDVHAWTAAAILGVDAKDVRPEDRRLAKVVNYGLVYGMGDHGLASRTDIPVERARAFLDEYMNRFAGVARWREEIVEQARRDGFVRTVSGRMRPAPGIADRNRGVAEAARRLALNAPVQGSAADIIKHAMVALEPRLASLGVGPGMILQVHDELVFEVEAGRAEEASAVVRAEMENAWHISVPLKVDVGFGPNWGAAH